MPERVFCVERLADLPVASQMSGSGPGAQRKGLQQAPLLPPEPEPKARKKPEVGRKGLHQRNSSLTGWEPPGQRGEGTHKGRRCGGPQATAHQGGSRSPTCPTPARSRGVKGKLPPQDPRKHRQNSRLSSPVLRSCWTLFKPRYLLRRESKHSLPPASHPP